MVVFLIILAALVGVGVPLYFLHRADERRAKKPASGTVAPLDTAPPSGTPAADIPQSPPASRSENDSDIDDEVCCGMHVTCEKDSLLPEVGQTIEYFDDEELDRFAGRGADSYSDDEIEEFRDVLLTLIPTDIAPWARSIQLRGITLPTPVRDELLMIVSEARAAKTDASGS